MKPFPDHRKTCAVLLLLLIGVAFYAIIAAQGHARAVMGKESEAVLILDPGHGGADGGAVSEEGLCESGINLDIALRLRELCRLFGIRTLMTREREELDYPPEADTIAKMKRWDTRERVRMINTCSHAILLSIHQNFYPSPQPRGPQLFYSDSLKAKTIAESMQNYMTENLCPGNRRLAVTIPSGVYVLEHAECPAILCECGFLSNREEAAALADESYRKKISVILLGAYLSAAEEQL